MNILPDLTGIGLAVACVYLWSLNKTWSKVLSVLLIVSMLGVSLFHIYQAEAQIKENYKILEALK